MSEINKQLESIRVNAVEDFDFYLGLALLLYSFDKHVTAIICFILAILCFYKRGFKNEQ